jgi:putative transposase
MDFVADQIFDGRKFRALTIVDDYTRKCLAIHVGQSIKGEEVSMIVQRVCLENCAFPERIQVDNGSEFISRALDKWGYDNKVKLDFRPGKPTDPPFTGSFNGSFRDECLNTNWFLSLEDAQDKIIHWKTEYNTFQQNSYLNDLTPDELNSYQK